LLTEQVRQKRSIRENKKGTDGPLAKLVLISPRPLYCSLSLTIQFTHPLAQEVARRIAESDERRRLQDLKMPATQYDLESK